MKISDRHKEMNRDELFAEMEDYGKSLLNPKIPKSLRKINQKYLDELIDFYEKNSQHSN